MRLISKPNLQRLIEADPHQRDYTTSKYYKPFIKNLYLKRVKIGLKLLGKKKYNKILDVGFGGGIITPELARHCGHLEGVDIHKHIKLVEDILKHEGIDNVHLQYSQLDSWPFEDNSFDCIWCLSVLEFVPEAEKMIQEIKRVAKIGAKIIIGFPVTNYLTNMAYKIIGFQNQQKHQSSHTTLLKHIKKHLKIKKIKRLPAYLPSKCSLFIVLAVTKND